MSSRHCLLDIVCYVCLCPLNTVQHRVRISLLPNNGEYLVEKKRTQSHHLSIIGLVNSSKPPVSLNVIQSLFQRICFLIILALCEGTLRKGVLAQTVKDAVKKNNKTRNRFRINRWITSFGLKIDIETMYVNWIEIKWIFMYMGNWRRWWRWNEQKKKKENVFHSELVIEREGQKDNLPLWSYFTGKFLLFFYF